MKATVNGTTAAYVGNYFEWSGSMSTMVSYYSLGGQRVAMRQGSVVSDVAGDHPGGVLTSSYSGSATRQAATAFRFRRANPQRPLKPTLSGNAK